MKVGMYYHNRDVRVQEVPTPELGERDLLIQVRACGICGSDLMEWYRIPRAPRVLGHELTGEVVAAGRAVRQFAAGDRVFTIHHVPCGECPECLSGHPTACVTFHTVNNFEPGGFSEYLKVKGKSVETGTLKLPPELSDEQGTFIEPLGTVLRSLRASGLEAGDNVLVLGSGLSGLLHIKAARALGAGSIVASDVHDFRLAAARRFGADHAVHAREDVPAFVRKVGGGRLARRVFVCTGAVAAAEQALKSVAPGGTVVFFAVPEPGQALALDLNPHWRNDVALKTSYGSAPQDHDEALALLRSGRVTVDDMVTHRFPLKDIAQGFRLAAEGSNCLKVVIRPNG